MKVDAMTHDAHGKLIRSEAAHQDKKILRRKDRPIHHADMQRYSRSGHLQAFFSKPFFENKSLSVLELGCGTGGNAIRIARLGHRVRSVDISPESIRYASKGADQYGVRDRLLFELCDIGQLTKKYSPGQFDVICGIGILHHLDSLRGTLNQIEQLKPRMIVFTEALGTNLLYQAIRRAFVGKSHTEEEHPLTKKDLLLIRDLFPGTRMLFSGAFPLYLLLKIKPFEWVDHFFSNLGPFWRCAKTVSFFWQRPPEV